MQDQIARLTSLRNAFTNAMNFGAPMPDNAAREYDRIKAVLLRTAEGTREWEKFCNRNALYPTHASSEIIKGLDRVAVDWESLAKPPGTRASRLASMQYELPRQAPSR